MVAEINTKPVYGYDGWKGAFRAKNICNAKFWDLGPTGTGVKNLSSKVPYLESPTLICLITTPLLWATMMIKGSLLLSTATVKHFQSEKTLSPLFWPNFDGFRG